MGRLSPSAQAEAAPFPQEIGAEYPQRHHLAQRSGQSRAAHPHSQAEVKDKVDVPHDVDRTASQQGGGADTGRAVVADEIGQHYFHHKGGHRPGDPLGVLHGVADQLVIRAEKPEQGFPQEQVRQRQHGGQNQPRRQRHRKVIVRRCPVPGAPAGGHPDGPADPQQQPQADHNGPQWVDAGDGRSAGGAAAVTYADHIHAGVN